MFNTWKQMDEAHRAWLSEVMRWDLESSFRISWQVLPRYLGSYAGFYRWRKVMRALLRS